VAGFRYRPKAQAKILFLLHALLKEIQECFSSHQSQEFSGINGLRLSTNGRFAPKDSDVPSQALNARLIALLLPFWLEGSGR
jgi:hypothetical protein